MDFKIPLGVAVFLLVSGCTFTQAPENSVSLFNQSVNQFVTTQQSINFNIAQPGNYCKLFVLATCNSCSASGPKIALNGKQTAEESVGGRISSTFDSFSAENSLVFTRGSSSQPGVPYLKTVEVYGIPAGSKQC